MDEVVLYICNRQKCGEKCGDHCEHTADIEYARNFKIAHEDGNKRIWVEIDEQPEIVRCRDCKHHFYERSSGIPYCNRIDYGYGWKDNDFCSRAERR